jgi:glutamate-1-semialdehyde 2,1-aminomutase
MAQATTELLAYRDPQSASAQLHRRALRVMPGGNTRTTVHLDPYPPYVVAGRGQIIVDAEGQERIDFLNNYTSLIHGHADPDIVEAVSQQARLGSSFGMPTPFEVDLAELLVERIASVEQLRFTSSGTEAVMIAVQAARAFTGRPMIAKFEGSYHGYYDFAAVSTAIRPGSTGNGAPEAIPLAKGTPGGVTENVAVLRYNDLDLLERVIAAHKDHLAAVLIDLMPWRMGLIAAEEPFLDRLRELTRAHDILLIVDEVITLRVAPGGMQSVVGIAPDLTTMGKVIGGGFPVGAVGGRADVMAGFDPRSGSPKVPHGGTFTANPVTMAAGLATMRKMTPEAYDRLNGQGAYLRQQLTQALDRAGIPGQVTGTGSLFGICFGDGPMRDFRGWLGGETERSWRGQVYSDLLARGTITAPHLVGCLSTPMNLADLDCLVDNVHIALERLSGAETPLV